jgi:hypothetical protein
MTPTEFDMWLNLAFWLAVGSEIIGLLGYMEDLEL